MSRKLMSRGCHGKYGDHRKKNVQVVYGNRVEWRESCKPASSLEHHTRPKMSRVSDSNERWLSFR